MFFGDADVYGKLQDEESKCLYKGRLHYAISHNTQDLYDALNTIHCEYYGWDLHYLERDYDPKKKIILYGSGNVGKHSLHILRNSQFKDRVEAFVDSNPNIIGSKVEGLSVISPNELLANHKDDIVIITSEIYLKEIYLALAKRGFPQSNIFVPQMGRLCAACGKQYFDMFEPLENEVFLDVGSYDGGTIIDYVDWRKKYNLGLATCKIIGFEASKEAIKRCRGVAEKLKINHFQLVEKGCYSKKGKMAFQDDYNSFVMACAHITSDGNNVIETDTIDNVLNGNKATFIKMDIEGSELEALKGAEYTLKTYKPRLAISLYHKSEDIFEIPQYILSVVPDYKLYIRHYTSDIWETVLYAE